VAVELERLIRELPAELSRGENPLPPGYPHAEDNLPAGRDQLQRLDKWALLLWPTDPMDHLKGWLWATLRAVPEQLRMGDIREFVTPRLRELIVARGLPE
jgi:hypothetical protein